MPLYTLLVIPGRMVGLYLTKKKKKRGRVWQKKNFVLRYTKKNNRLYNNKPRTNIIHKRIKLSRNLSVYTFK